MSRTKVFALAKDLSQISKIEGLRYTTVDQLVFLLIIHSCSDQGISIKNLVIELKGKVGAASVSRSIGKFSVRSMPDNPLIDIYLDSDKSLSKIVCLTDRGKKVMDKIVKLMRG